MRGRTVREQHPLAHRAAKLCLRLTLLHTRLPAKSQLAPSRGVRRVMTREAVMADVKAEARTSGLLELCTVTATRAEVLRFQAKIEWLRSHCKRAQ